MLISSAVMARLDPAIHRTRNRSRMLARWMAASSAAMTMLVGALFLSFAFAAPAHADPTFPPLTGRVVDDAHILSQDAQDRLTAMSAALEQKNHDQLVIVTLPSLQGYTIEQYGYQLGRHWGIGQKGHDNGALLIVAPKEHKVRIEVGYGLEGTLTDAQSELIIHNVMLPDFRRGDYDTGVLAGAANILQVLGVKTKDVDQVLAQQQQMTPQQNGGGGGGIPIVLILIVVWLVFGRFFWPLLFLGGFGGFGGRGGFGGGSFGGGSFGGGGFSGGGGSFGGGGASGGW
jgi:uncharacterized protein